MRVPNLQTLPKLTDEMRDAIFSLPIARGQTFPLANFSSYDGALFNYLQAALFHAVGPSLLAPRAMMLWLGVLTLPAAYLCARRAHGPVAALLATALLAVNPVHILVNSHVAWGNCLTPLFTTLAFWLVYQAIGPSYRSGSRSPADGDWLLVPAGLCFGLALQTHPTVVGLLPGVAIAVLFARPGLLARPWLWLGLLGFALGYANMIAFNVLHNFESVRFAQQTQSDYTGAGASLGERYESNLATMLVGLYRMLGGAVEDRAGRSAFLLDPMLILAALLTAAGLAWAARRGDRLPLLVSLSHLLLLPLFNDRFEPVLDGRYVMPLLPLLFAAAARLLVDLWRTRDPWGGRLGPALSVAAATSLLVAPLVGLSRYSEQNQAAGLRSARLWAALGLAERNVPQGTEVILDRDLKRSVLGAGSTEQLAFEYAFTMHGVPYRSVRVTPGGLAAAVNREGVPETRLVVMERNKRKKMGTHLQLRRLDASLSERGVQPSAYAVYLVTWRADRP
ncbi:MAG: glycosyltransferase family 39 protein [Chloroflexi bacterium]|nr:glycosyltransferase family 39 protein [Chloroflexota bacterium]